VVEGVEKDYAGFLIKVDAKRQEAYSGFKSILRAAFLLARQSPLYTRTRRLPDGGLDVIGITPDVPVPDHLNDPLAFAVRLLAAEAVTEP
jgi:hypothetical protein